MKTDIEVRAVELYFLPVEMRVPLKFGTETMDSVTCARVRVDVRNREGQETCGWGETPLSAAWAWPGRESYAHRHETMKHFCGMLAEAWTTHETSGHAIELGSAFLDGVLPGLLDQLNAERGREREPMPWLAALVCNSAFDIAVHDAYGILLDRPVYATYNAEFMNRDLSTYLEPADSSDVRFTDQYPADFLVFPAPTSLPAWHLVGGKDLLDESECTGDEPDDGYPVVLPDWIRRDGLTCLKVKLTGNDSAWDYERLARVGDIALAQDVRWLSTDFNCTVTEPEYVNTILDRLRTDHPRISDMILYVEQPFPYELETNQIDVHSVSSRKPLFMDESAHGWEQIRLGRELGWTGVALKTCKTQTGALLSLCWAQAHRIDLMVQDLTNPMLAQIPHVLLAAHAGTIMGVETNGMQFYPAASAAEEAVHPGLYQRRGGCVDLSSLGGPGFGYRLGEIRRELPGCVSRFER